jgi:hypothetical protein
MVHFKEQQLLCIQRHCVLIMQFLYVFFNNMGFAICLPKYNHIDLTCYWKPVRSLSMDKLYTFCSKVKLLEIIFKFLYVLSKYCQMIFNDCGMVCDWLKKNTEYKLNYLFFTTL